MTAAEHLLLWDDPLTAGLYGAFTDRHERYRAANAALAAASGISPGRSVLDVGAGLGCTGRACLDRLGAGDEVVCVEPATAMRELGRQRTKGLPVAWRADLPAGRSFHRVLCGAAIWAMTPVGAAIARLAALVIPGGKLAFSIPAAYLGEPDEPGGGMDPWLTALPARLSELGLGRPVPATPGAQGAIDLARELRLTGLRPETSRIRTRLTQAALRDWLKLPPVNYALLGAVPATERPALIEKAYRHVDADSWRWESWAILVATSER